MACEILATATEEHPIIDQAIVDDLAAEIVLERHPGIEDRERAFHAFTAATTTLIRPSLERLALAYRHACQTPASRAAARLFLKNLLEAEA